MLEQNRSIFQMCVSRRNGLQLLRYPIHPSNIVSTLPSELILDPRISDHQSFTSRRTFWSPIIAVKQLAPDGGRLLSIIQIVTRFFDRLYLPKIQASVKRWDIRENAGSVDKQKHSHYSEFGMQTSNRLLLFAQREKAIAAERILQGNIMDTFFQ